jgi:hypothetical protein
VLANGCGDARAQLDAVAPHVAVAVTERKWRRAITVGEDDRMAIPDTFERGRGMSNARRQGKRRNHGAQRAQNVGSSHCRGVLRSSGISEQPEVRKAVHDSLVAVDASLFVQCHERRVHVLRPRALPREIR